MKDWKKWPIGMLERGDTKFPKLLLEVSPTIKTIYYRGVWAKDLFKKALTVVGSRRMTRYGKEVVERFMPDLVANGVTIISGFMYGVDTEAHRQCLDCGGKTIAVVGGGLDQLTVAENDGLYSRILNSGGVVMSEYEASFKPTNWSFPQRDRIMSALATLGVLVVEGGVKSGSLITANFAMKQGKRLLAVPGPIDSTVSMGPNWLIKSGGAKMVTEVADILEDGMSRPEQPGLFKDYANLSAIEKQIVDVLENEAVTMDELCRKLGLGVTVASTTISMMLMRGLIEEQAGKFYLS